MGHTVQDLSYESSRYTGHGKYPQWGTSAEWKGKSATGTPLKTIYPSLVDRAGRVPHVNTLYH